MAACHAPGVTTSLAVCCCDGGGPSWTVCYCNGGVPSMPTMTVLDLPPRRPVRRWLRGVVDIESARPHFRFPGLVVDPRHDGSWARL